MAEHTNPEHAEPELNPTVAHERTEEDVRAVTGFGIGLALGIVVVVFAMWGLFQWFYARADRANPPVAPVVLQSGPQLPPEPRLQAQPRIDLKALREGEDHVLNSAAWLDPNRGIARIPIADAIDIVASKGTLKAQPSSDLPDAQGYREIPSVASSGRTLEKISQ